MWPPALTKKLLATLLGLIGAAALIEVGLWVLATPPQRPFLQEYYGERFKIMCYRENTSGDLDRDLRSNDVREAYAKRLGQTDFLGTWKATPFCVEIQFNSAGFRELEIGPKAAAITRIGVIGDSFTYGHGLPEQAPFPRQLEGLLRKRFGEGRFEVLNLGIGAIDLPQVVEVGEGALRAMELDVLLYAYFINDGIPLEGLQPPSGVNAVIRTGWAHVARGNGRLSLGARPGRFPRSAEVIERLLEQRKVSKATIEYYRWLHNAENWPKIAAVIARLESVARSRGAMFAVVPLPIPFNMGHDYPFADVHANIARDLRSRSIQVIDVLPTLVSYGETELSLHPEDLHPNARYHAVVAQVLFDEIFAHR